MFLHPFVLSIFVSCISEALLLGTYPFMIIICFPDDSDGKESAYNAGKLGSIPGLGRSSGEGNGYPPWYACLENSMDWGAWQVTVQGWQRVRHDWATHTFTFTASWLVWCFLQYKMTLCVIRSILSNINSHSSLPMVMLQDVFHHFELLW